MQIDKFKINASEQAVKDAADRVIGGISAQHALDDEGAFTIRLVLNELLNNIIEHSDATEIEVSAGVEQGTVRLDITDNSDGFSYAERLQEDVTVGEGLEQGSGRGIFIVKAMSDVLRYNDAGNSVQVELSCLG